MLLLVTKSRELSFKEDFIKYKEHYGYDILENHDVQFMCYQSAYKLQGEHFDIVIADEIHDALTPKYILFFRNNKYKHLLGLSATIDKNSVYEIDEISISKLDLLEEIAPIVYKYTINQGQEEEVSRKLNIYVIDHYLDSKESTIKITYKDKKGNNQEFSTTEFENYKYINNAFIKAIYSKNKSDFLIRKHAAARANLLYTCKSKTRLIKEILNLLNRTLIFGNNIDVLDELCPTVSSRNSKEKNIKLIDDFNKGVINTIGSFKMLKQGITLNNLDNVIFHSYFGIQKDLIQRFGRLRKSDKDGNVFIIKTKNTVEEKWFKKMMSDLDSFTIINCESIEELYKKYKKV